MDLDTLRRLTAAGEKLNVEFKSEARTALPDRELVEAAVCLANRVGDDSAWLFRCRGRWSDHWCGCAALQSPGSRQAGTSEGTFLRRTLGGDGRPACVPMDGAAIQSLQADRGLLDPAAQVVAGADWDDLDVLEFERFRRSVRERRGRSDESLLALSDLDLANAAPL